MEQFVDELEEVCRLRSKGDLIGATGADLTKRHVDWVGQRAGVPVLRPDRLRATWLVKQLEMGTGVVELVGIAGLKSCDSLSEYLAYVDFELPSCAVSQ